MRYIRNVGIAGAVLSVLVSSLVLASGAFGGAARHVLAAEVHVTLTDTHFAMTPGTLTSQLASFDVALVVVNRGTKSNVFTIKGPGLSGIPTKSGVRAARIGPGSSTTLRVKLLTGAYQLSDSVGSGRGTAHWLVVHPATVGNGGATTPVAPPVANPAFPPGETATNSWMQCGV